MRGPAATGTTSVAPKLPTGSSFLPTTCGFEPPWLDRRNIPDRRVHQLAVAHMSKNATPHDSLAERASAPCLHLSVALDFLSRLCTSRNHLCLCWCNLLQHAQNHPMLRGTGSARDSQIAGFPNRALTCPRLSRGSGCLRRRRNRNFARRRELTLAVVTCLKTVMHLCSVEKCWKATTALLSACLACKGAAQPNGTATSQCLQRLAGSMP